MSPSEAKTIRGFAITPAKADACIVVFHEVWGLVNHTKAVCKRLGKLRFATTAPNLYRGYEDLLTPENIQKAMEAIWDLSLEQRRDRGKVATLLRQKHVPNEVKDAVAVIYDQGFREKLLNEAVAAVEDAHSNFNQVSTLGFCLGGGLSLNCATKCSYLKSAISFYGEPPTKEAVQEISMPVLAAYASHDELINAKVPSFVEAMLAGGKDLTLKTYPNTRHGFFNETRKDVYDRNAAGEAWDVTKWFLERTLR